MQHRGVSGDPIIISERAVEKQNRAIEELRIMQSGLRAASTHAANDSPWFAFRIMAGRELTVENALKNEGVECIVPLRKGRELRRRGRVSLPTIPVMVSYVLVRFEPTAAAFAGVLRMDHMIGVVGGSAEPRTISDCEVRLFVERARDGWFDWSRRSTDIKKGTRVIVTHGPFKGAVGVIMSSRSDGLGDAVVGFNDDEKIPPALLPLAILEKL